MRTICTGLGAAWSEAQLVDYDAAGNWANVGGVGTDKRDCGSNALTQARRYDADMPCISYWVPELPSLALDQRQVPFFLSDEERAAVDY